MFSIEGPILAYLFSPCLFLMREMIFFEGVYSGLSFLFDSGFPKEAQKFSFLP